VLSAFIYLLSQLVPFTMLRVESSQRRVLVPGVQPEASLLGMKLMELLV
jgi:hypothetical protein